MSSLHFDLPRSVATNITSILQSYAYSCHFASATDDKVNMALSDVVKIARDERKKNKPNKNKKPKEGGKNNKNKDGKITPGDKVAQKMKAEGKANRDAKKDQKRGLNKDGKPQKDGKNNAVSKIAQNALKKKGNDTPTLKITINTTTLEASTDKKLLSQVKAALSKEGKGPKGPNIVKPGIRKIVMK